MNQIDFIMPPEQGHQADDEPGAPGAKDQQRRLDGVRQLQRERVALVQAAFAKFSGDLIGYSSDPALSSPSFRVRNMNVWSLSRR